MDVLEVIHSRYSARSYKRDEVDQEKLQRILEAAVLAPTAANRQAFRVLVISTEGRQEELKKIYGRDWFVGAPLILGVCALPRENWVRRDGKNYSDVDAAIVMDHIILAAASQGLGTCWVGAFHPDIARQVLKLGDELEPVAFTPLGYATDGPSAKVRKPLGDLIMYK